MTADHDRIPEIALDWHRSGRRAALATVIETWGSAPRPVGAQLAIAGDGEMMGSVSGGCVEGAVVVEALEAFDDQSCRILEYGVADDDAFAVGLACGGTIRILVEPVGTGGHSLPEALLAELVDARAARRPIGISVDTVDFTRMLICYGDAPARFDADRSGFAEGSSVFTAIHNPPLRLAIVGAVHIAQALAQMARIAGYDVTVIDPRAAFGSDGRFPDETLVEDWPDAALASHGLDIRTAVVTLTHDPKLDDPALISALRSPVFYIGALGSTRTHAKRVARLTAEGFGAEDLARIDAPIGLDIGAKSPAEIAVAVMAEITQRLRRPASRPGASVQAVA
ncbi:MAG: XdhC/CoxI family protein [Pseudomonadota bacterium]